MERFIKGGGDDEMFNTIISHLHYTTTVANLHPGWNPYLLVPAILVIGTIIVSVLYWLLQARRWMVLMALGVLAVLALPQLNFISQGFMSHVSTTVHTVVSMSHVVRELP